MRILLRRYRSGEFFRAVDDWTPSPTKAFDFRDTEPAIRKARELGQTELDVVVVHEDGSVLFGRRLTEAELGQGAGQATPETAKAHAACEPPPRPLSILVAEDLESDAKLLRMAFNRAGVTGSMNFVRDGAETIEYLKASSVSSGQTRTEVPTMLLLDLKMPRVDGFEVLDWLRGQTGLKRMVVIVLSASALKMDVNRAYDLGANSYLVKPHDFNELEGLARNLRHYWMDYNCYPDFSPQMSEAV